MNARDKRGVFAIPRGAVTYLGTTDTDYGQPEDDPDITLDDVGYLLDAANRTFDVDPPLGPDDVVSAWAGLRPLLHQEGKKPSELSRKDEIMVGPAGLMSVAGGKLTTFRRMSERVVDMACERLQAQGMTAPPRRTATARRRVLGSGDTGDDVAAFAERLCSAVAAASARDVVDRLVALYGSNAERLVDGIARRPGAGASGSRRDLPVTRAEVEYAVREEMALTLEDFLERRSRLLLWEPDNGLAVADGVARIMAAALGWDAARDRTTRSARYRALVERLKSFDGETAEAETAQAAHG